MNWLPVIIAVIALYFLRSKKKRILFPILLCLYLLTVFLIVIIPSLFEMTATGKGDPQLIAGQISEKLVNSILNTVFHIPIIAVLFWWFRRPNQNKMNNQN